MPLAESDTRALEARTLIRSALHAALGTSQPGEDGAGPYVSLVAVATDHDASPLLLLSDLAQHTRNLLADRRVSLLFAAVEPMGDPLAAGRVTLLGRAERVDDPRLLARFTRRHPSSGSYAGFGDFHLYRVVIERGHLVAGFGRISWVEGDVLRFGLGAPALAAAEPEIIEHMNTDHADAVALFAAHLLGRPGGGWRMSGIDPEGLDLIQEGERGYQFGRLGFNAPVLDPGNARKALIQLTQAARERIASRPE